MEIERVEVEKLKELQDSARFLFFTPKNIEITDISFRNEGRKWSTLRFVCDVGGERARVKEFFLDWFYSGFPKSLMQSFVSSYSPVEMKNRGEGVSFFGRNYKNKDASSSFFLGTQVEVEGDSMDTVKRVTDDLHAPFLIDKFKHLSFVDRSFFARGGKPEWFEEERITRMEWRKLEGETLGDSLRTDSEGVLRCDGNVAERIVIISEPYFRRVIWVDSAIPDSQVGNLFYELRESNGLFIVRKMGHGIMADAGRMGPAIYQEKKDGNITTITFSPLFSYSEINSLLPQLEWKFGMPHNLFK
jgi:hypothetical protein